MDFMFNRFHSKTHDSRPFASIPANVKKNGKVVRHSFGPFSHAHRKNRLANLTNMTLF